MHILRHNGGVLVLSHGRVADALFVCVSRVFDVTEPDGGFGLLPWRARTMSTRLIFPDLSFVDPQNELLFFCSFNSYLVR